MDNYLLNGMTIVLTAAAITCTRLGPVIDEKGEPYETLTPLEDLYALIIGRGTGIFQWYRY